MEVEFHPKSTFRKLRTKRFSYRFACPIYLSRTKSDFVPTTISNIMNYWIHSRKNSRKCYPKWDSNPGPLVFKSWIRIPVRGYCQACDLFRMVEVICYLRKNCNNWRIRNEPKSCLWYEEMQFFNFKSSSKPGRDIFSSTKSQNNAKCLSRLITSKCLKILQKISFLPSKIVIRVSF